MLDATIRAAFTVLGQVTEGTPGVTLPAAIRCGDGDIVHQMQSLKVCNANFIHIYIAYIYMYVQQHA